MMKRVRKYFIAMLEAVAEADHVHEENQEVKIK